MGTDRNIADWVLESRIDTLISFVAFYHHDLELISELYPDTASLSAKLYHMFETYMKILVYGSHMFLNIPTVQLPKVIEELVRLRAVLGGLVGSQACSGPEQRVCCGFESRPSWYIFMTQKI